MNNRERFEAWVDFFRAALEGSAVHNYPQDHPATMAMRTGQFDVVMANAAEIADRAVRMIAKRIPENPDEVQT